MNLTMFLIALMALVIGLSLYGWSAKGKSEHFHSAMVICWLLIALFPVILLFSIFPNSQMTGKLLGFSFTGAVAMFIFIWWYGTISALKASKMDNLSKEKSALEAELGQLRARTGSPGNQRLPKPLPECKTYIYKLKKGHGSEIVLVTGNLANIKQADCWVNSENTNMQMSRYFERSISATIRYLGARKDHAGNVVEDLIADELAAKLGTSRTVQPATVFATGSGELLTTHHVKRILHVASVQGQVGQGYRAIENIAQCVTNTLQTAEGLAKADDLNSILFPLLGTGQAKSNLSEVLHPLFIAAISFFEGNPNMKIRRAYFLAWTDLDLEACQDTLSKPDLANRISITE